jgi:hypothetical protein
VVTNKGKKIANGMTVKEFANSSTGKEIGKVANALKATIKNTIFSNYSTNFLPDGFKSHGYYEDLNLANDATTNWTLASAYLHLQEAGLVERILVYRTNAGKDTNYMFDNAAIADYFKTNPTPETNPLLIKEEQPKR